MSEIERISIANVRYCLKEYLCDSAMTPDERRGCLDWAATELGRYGHDISGLDYARALIVCDDLLVAPQLRRVA